MGLLAAAGAKATVQGELMPTIVKTIRERGKERVDADRKRNDVLGVGVPEDGRQERNEKRTDANLMSTRQISLSTCPPQPTF